MDTLFLFISKMVDRNPWDRCDPMWCSGKVLDRTSRGAGPGFNSPTGPDFFSVRLLASVSS